MNKNYGFLFIIVAIVQQSLQAGEWSLANITASVRGKLPSAPVFSRDTFTGNNLRAFGGAAVSQSAEFARQHPTVLAGAAWGGLALHKYAKSNLVVQQELRKQAAVLLAGAGVAGAAYYSPAIASGLSDLNQLAIRTERSSTFGTLAMVVPPVVVATQYGYKQYCELLPEQQKYVRHGLLGLGVVGTAGLGFAYQESLKAGAQWLVDKGSEVATEQVKPFVMEQAVPFVTGNINVVAPAAVGTTVAAVGLVGWLRGWFGSSAKTSTTNATTLTNTTSVPSTAPVVQPQGIPGASAPTGSVAQGQPVVNNGGASAAATSTNNAITGSDDSSLRSFFDLFDSEESTVGTPAAKVVTPAASGSSSPKPTPKTFGTKPETALFVVPQSDGPVVLEERPVDNGGASAPAINDDSGSDKYFSTNEDVTDDEGTAVSGDSKSQRRQRLVRTKSQQLPTASTKKTSTEGAAKNSGDWLDTSGSGSEYKEEVEPKSVAQELGFKLGNGKFAAAQPAPEKEKALVVKNDSKDSKTKEVVISREFLQQALQHPSVSDDNKAQIRTMLASGGDTIKLLVDQASLGQPNTSSMLQFFRNWMQEPNTANQSLFSQLQNLDGVDSESIVPTAASSAIVSVVQAVQNKEEDTKSKKTKPEVAAKPATLAPSTTASAKPVTPSLATSSSVTNTGGEKLAVKLSIKDRASQIAQKLITPQEAVAKEGDGAQRVPGKISGAQQAAIAGAIGNGKQPKKFNKEDDETKVDIKKRMAVLQGKLKLQGMRESDFETKATVNAELASNVATNEPEAEGAQEGAVGFVKTFFTNLLTPATNVTPPTPPALPDASILFTTNWKDQSTVTGIPTAPTLPGTPPPPPSMAGLNLSGMPAAPSVVPPVPQGSIPSFGAAGKDSGRAQLFNAIGSGGFKLKPTQTNDKSAARSDGKGVVDGAVSTTDVSNSGDTTSANAGQEGKKEQPKGFGMAGFDPSKVRLRSTRIDGQQPKQEQSQSSAAANLRSGLKQRAGGVQLTQQEQQQQQQVRQSSPQPAAVATTPTAGSATLSPTSPAAIAAAVPTDSSNNQNGGTVSSGAAATPLPRSKPPVVSKKPTLPTAAKAPMSPTDDQVDEKKNKYNGVNENGVHGGEQDLPPAPSPLSSQVFFGDEEIFAAAARAAQQLGSQATINNGSPTSLSATSAATPKTNGNKKPEAEGPDTGSPTPPSSPVALKAPVLNGTAVVPVTASKDSASVVPQANGVDEVSDKKKYTGKTWTVDTESAAGREPFRPTVSDAEKAARTDLLTSLKEKPAGQSKAPVAPVVVVPVPKPVDTGPIVVNTAMMEQAIQKQREEEERKAQQKAREKQKSDQYRMFADTDTEAWNSGADTDNEGAGGLGKSNLLVQQAQEVLDREGIKAQQQQEAAEQKEASRRKMEELKRQKAQRGAVVNPFAKRRGAVADTDGDTTAVETDTDTNRTKPKGGDGRPRAWSESDVEDSPNASAVMAAGEDRRTPIVDSTDSSPFASAVMPMASADSSNMSKSVSGESGKDKMSSSMHKSATTGKIKAAEFEDVVRVGNSFISVPLLPSKINIKGNALLLDGLKRVNALDEIIKLDNFIHDPSNQIGKADTVESVRSKQAKLEKLLNDAAVASALQNIAKDGSIGKNRFLAPLILYVEQYRATLKDVLADMERSQGPKQGVASRIYNGVTSLLPTWGKKDATTKSSNESAVAKPVDTMSASTAAQNNNGASDVNDSNGSKTDDDQ